MTMMLLNTGDIYEFASNNRLSRRPNATIVASVQSTLKQMFTCFLGITGERWKN